ncbi:MAG: 50S ribosomal protein L17 [Ignavibacteriaceae bacterium]|jgi:large subunit ribosomal protein L17|nr:50S ribosomal protein L17 [Ignavibacteriaceae bacterium]
MRHNVKGRKLGRTASHRKATLNSLVTSLLKYKRIKTTLAKAKETRGFAEKLVTKARKGDLHAKKQVMEVIKDKEVVKELFSEILPKIGDRPGGYTRVVKLGYRMGDAAQMAILELVDYNEVVTARAEQQKEKREAKVKEKAEKAKAEKDDQLLEQQASEAPVK